MPGKHAPASPASFHWSVARAAGAVVAVIGLAIAIIVVATGGDEKPTATPTQSASRSPSPSPTPTTVVTPSPSPPASPEPAEVVTVAVLNGTDVSGLARKVSNRLRSAGYTIADTGNATKDLKKTIIYYRPGAEKKAEELRGEHFDFVAASQVRPAGDAPDARARAMITVVLGEDYPG